MRGTPIFILFLCITAGSRVLASEPPKAAPLPAQSAPVAENAQVAAAPTGPSAASMTQAAADMAKEAQMAAQVNKLRSAGYKPRVHDGRQVFCRKEAQLGSRFETEVCRSPEELDKSTLSGKDMAGDAQRSQLNPVGK